MAKLDIEEKFKKDISKEVANLKEFLISQGKEIVKLKQENKVWTIIGQNNILLSDKDIVLVFDLEKFEKLNFLKLLLKVSRQNIYDFFSGKQW